MTGLGKKGPERNLPAYDHTIYWARAGWSHRLALKGQAIVGKVEAFGDTVAATVLAYGIMTALYMRERTGVGQEVDVNLLQTGIFHAGWELSGALSNPQDMQMSERTAAGGALNICYLTKDGRWLRLGFTTPERFWSKFCQAIDREDLEHDPRFQTTEVQRQNNVALISILDEVFLSKSLDEWKACFPDDIPWAVVQNIPEVCSDPQARINGVFITYDHPVYGPIEVLANPVNLSKAPAEIRRPAPEHGQHTEEVLLEYGCTWEDIAKLKEEGIVA